MNFELSELLTIHAALEGYAQDLNTLAQKEALAQKEERDPAIYQQEAENAKRLSRRVSDEIKKHKAVHSL